MIKFPLLLWRYSRAVFRSCPGSLLPHWRRFAEPGAWAAPAERHTASAASAWLEPQRLHVRSLRLPPPGTFPGFQGFQIQVLQRQRACERAWARVSPEPCPVSLLTDTRKKTNHTCPPFLSLKNKCCSEHGMLYILLLQVCPSERYMSVAGSSIIPVS